jgi:hypothetical protein
MNRESTVKVTVAYLDALRKAVGLHVDPETAQVDWRYAATLDPYDDCPELPEECRDIGRQYFARSPGADVWISFYDLPHATRDALWERQKSKLVFPAGLEPARQIMATMNDNQPFQKQGGSTNE